MTPHPDAPLEAEPLEAESVPLPTGSEPGLNGKAGKAGPLAHLNAQTLRENVQWLIAIAIIAILLLAAIAYNFLAEEEIPVHGIRAPVKIEHTMNIHFVTVGFEEGLFDESYILDRVTTEYEPWDTLRSGLAGFPLVQQEYQRFYYNFEFHTASDEFAQELFNAAGDYSEYYDLGDEGNLWYDEENHDYLKIYDTTRGHGRLLLDLQGNVQLIDAIQLEDWIEANKGRHGLDFGVNSYTFFLIDSWSRMESDFGNVLPVDEYHYYKFYEADWERRGIHTMRAWGGTYDFLWLDVGAAPNFYEVVDDDTGSQYSFAGSAEDDPPVWDLDCPNPFFRVTESEFNANIARDFHYALNFRFSPSYIYHPTYAPEYYLNAFVYYEEAPVTQDEQTALDMEEVLDRIRVGFPWARVNGEVHFHYEYGDDPGFYDAIEDCKIEEQQTCDVEVLIRHVETHREMYYLGPEEAFQIMAIFIQFEDSVYSVAAPVAPQGVAMYGPDRKPWGIFQVNNEGHRRAEDNPTTPGAGVFPWTSVAAHEAGHFFGLHHPHDGMLRYADGTYTGGLHWLWDQSATLMSYRTHTYAFDGLDIDQLARGHIMENTNDARRNLDIAFEMLLADGLEKIPRKYQDQVDDIEEGIDEAIVRYHQGRYVAGVPHAEKAIKTSWKLMDDISDDTGLRLDARRVDLDWNGSASGGFVDYQPLDITTEMEKLNITIYWNNSGGAADLFAGYTFFPEGVDGDGQDENEGRGAVFNYYQQGAGESDCVETLIVDLDDDGIREHGHLWVGTGSNDDGDNVPYHVVVTTEYRESGLYWERNGIESF